MQFLKNHCLKFHWILAFLLLWVIICSSKINFSFVFIKGHKFASSIVCSYLINTSIVFLLKLCLYISVFSIEFCSGGFFIFLRQNENICKDKSVWFLWYLVYQICKFYLSHFILFLKSMIYKVSTKSIVFIKFQLLNHKVAHNLIANFRRNTQ